jgi:hypothetical protein
MSLINRPFLPVVLALAIGLLAATGCFETALSLGPAEQAKVDVNYVGDWNFTWKDDDQPQSAQLLLRNFDGKRYLVEWKQSGEKVLRFSGYLVPVKSATFAQLTLLSETGEVPDKHLIVRVQLDGKKLVLRHLDGDFFADVKTDTALRAKVEENLDNEAMYLKGGTISGSPVSGE